MRGDDPVIVLLPGVGMWSFGTDVQQARIAGEFFVNVVNVMRGAESGRRTGRSTTPRSSGWSTGSSKRRSSGAGRPHAPSPDGSRSVTGAASGIGRAIAERFATEGACIVVSDIDVDGAEKVAAELGTERVFVIELDVSDEVAVDAAFARRRVAVRQRRHRGEQRRVRSLERTGRHHCRTMGPAARGPRGGFVPRQPGRGPDDDERRDRWRHRLRGVEERDAAGPENVAYGAAKADQAHQVRLLAAELGEVGIRVNGVNPDGVVEGSGIFDGAWREAEPPRYGVAPEDLGDFYASRTLLRQGVVPRTCGRRRRRGRGCAVAHHRPPRSRRRWCRRRLPALIGTAMTVRIAPDQIRDLEASAVRPTSATSRRSVLDSPTTGSRPSR